MKFSNLSDLCFWSAAIVLLSSGIVLPGLVGFLRSDYSWVSDYISELGAHGAEYAQLINLFGFLPVAFSSAVAIFCLSARLPDLRLSLAGLVLLFFGLSVGYLGAFFFPCDYGCPDTGSSRQMIHNLFGLAAYPVGTLGLILLAVGLTQKSLIGLRIPIFVVAALTAIGFVFMLVPDQADLRGFWQRLADYSMFALILYLGVKVPTRK